MDGVHDMGGVDGFGRVRVELDEPVFHARWEGRVFGMVLLLNGAGMFVTDAFRHAVESVAPDDYLSRGYYGRWLLGLERLLLHAGAVTPEQLRRRDPHGEAPAVAAPAVPFGPPVPAPTAGSLRVIRTRPRFAVGQPVVTRDLRPAGHTRLPRYVRGKAGVIERVHPAWVFPDSHAHGLGENAQYAYAVRFTGSVLWGEDAEPGVSVCVDLFETYLRAVPA